MWFCDNIEVGGGWDGDVMSKSPSMSNRLPCCWAIVEEEVGGGLLEVPVPKFMSPKISNRRAESFSGGGPLGLPIREMPPAKIEAKKICNCQYSIKYWLC